MSSVPHAIDSTSSRPLADDGDWWLVRSLLLDKYPLTPPDWNWDVRRWDGQRFHRRDSTLGKRWSESVRLWFASDGRLVGAVHPEGEGTVWWQLDPDFRHLEPEMLDWAESALAQRVAATSQRELHAFAYEYDSPRTRLLRARRYVETAEFGVVRRLRLGSQTLPQAGIASGYRLRTTRPDEESDCQLMASLLNAAFRRTSHSADEYRNFSSHSPSFRHDLNLLAEAPDGSFAAHVGVTYDEINRRGIFEPVCTHPNHRRLGLARTLLYEGMQRLKGLGATAVYVGTGDDEAANQFYEAVGFTEAYKGRVWRKVW